jgi:ABC-type sulfate transport system substrate-binding protein
VRLSTGVATGLDADVALLNFRQDIGDCDEIGIDMEDGQAVVNSGGAYQ